MFYLIMNIFLNWQFSKYLFCPDTNQFFVGFIFLVFPGLDSCEKITIHEIYEPIILFIVLAFLQSQIVSPLKYKNLDFFEQHPVISTSSGGEPKNIPQRKTSAAEQRRISVSRKNSTKTGATTSSRKTTPVRKLSRRLESDSCQRLALES